MSSQKAKTLVYCVRHAEADNSVRDNMARPLTDAGFQAAESLVGVFAGIPVDYMYASPMLRAIQTLAPLARAKGLGIPSCEGVREREIGTYVDDYDSFSRLQWENFQHKHEDGESLAETQTRAIQAIDSLVALHAGKTIVIGTHGTALGTIRAAYDPAFGYEAFRETLPWLPYIVLLEFSENNCERISLVPLDFK